MHSIFISWCFSLLFDNFPHTFIYKMQKLILLLFKYIHMNLSVHPPYSSSSYFFFFFHFNGDGMQMVDCSIKYVNLISKSGNATGIEFNFHIKMMMMQQQQHRQILIHVYKNIFVFFAHFFSKSIQMKIKSMMC